MNQWHDQAFQGGKPGWGGLSLWRPWPLSCSTQKLITGGLRCTLKLTTFVAYEQIRSRNRWRNWSPNKGTIVFKNQVQQRVMLYHGRLQSVTCYRFPQFWVHTNVCVKLTFFLMVAMHSVDAQIENVIYQTYALCYLLHYQWQWIMKINYEKDKMIGIVSLFFGGAFPFSGFDGSQIP